MADFDGRVAVVTGGSSGIGLAAARALRERGARVALAGIDADEAVAAGRSLGGPDVAFGVGVDVTQEEAVRELVELAVDRFGSLDVLVTAAGIQRYGDAVDTSAQLWDEVQAVNLRGAFFAVKYALPHLRGSGHGAIVVVASVQAFITQTTVAAYSTSKAALTGLVRSVAVDEAAHNVRANAVCPGSVDTPMLREAARRFSDGTDAGEQSLVESWGRMHPLGRVARPEDVAEAICYLASDRAAFVTGVSLPVDGGLTSVVPVVIPQ